MTRQLSRLGILALLLVSACVSRADDEKIIAQWMDAQKTIETWSADFTQTRKLKTFAQPLQSEGHLWFQAPSRFRWELGNPPQTIAIRRENEMTIVYPKLKRAEKYPLSGNLPSQWKDALALLEAGFPRDRKDLDTRFTIESVTTTNSTARISLQPKSAAARKMMPRINIEFSVDNHFLRATELHFADGSVMRNDFKNPKVNEAVSEKHFTAEIPPDYKIVEPLRPSK